MKDTYIGCQSCPHSPRSVPTNFDMNSESGLINDNTSRAEPLSSGRNRISSMPIKQLVQSSQRRGVGNIPKPLAGGHELLLTNQELSGSGEDHRTLRRPEEGVGNESSFGDKRPGGVYQLQTSSRASPKDLRRSRKVPRTMKARAKAKASGTDLTQKVTGFPNWSLQQWKVSSIWPELLWNSQQKSRKG
ncbi:hypothetical protein O181_104316 [Austropuccinia psidii MF-1]|uniref:Uncharacterized protein n=1 Tax=Austropuccinia psidii MF-1 TaxID=1389203 RepID=A0A9Q3JLZ3_9BASI|nr:hypothetical protein [Austropuccinia psidii MF-1]